MFTLAVQGQVILLLSLISLGTFIWLLVLGFQRHIFWAIAIFLFAPISGLVFTIKYWAEARIPYIVFMIAVSGYWYFSMDLARRSLPMQEIVSLAQDVQEGKLSREEATHALKQQIDQAAQVRGIVETRGKAMQRAIMDEEEGLAAKHQAEPEPSPQTHTANERAAPSRTTIPAVKPTPTTTALSPSLPPLPVSPPVQEEAPVKPAMQDVPLEEAGKHVGQAVVVTTKAGLSHQGTLARIDEDESLWLSQRLRGGEFSFQVRREDIAALSLQLKSAP